MYVLKIEKNNISLIDDVFNWKETLILTKNNVWCFISCDMGGIYYEKLRGKELNFVEKEYKIQMRQKKLERILL